MKFNKNILLIITAFIAFTSGTMKASSDYDKTRKPIPKTQTQRKTNTPLDKTIPVLKPNYHYYPLGHSHGLQNYPGKTMYPTQNSKNMPFATGRSFAGNDVTF